MTVKGIPVWYEMIADDADAAERFYGDVVGWRAQPGDAEGIDYRILSAPDGAAIAGLMARMEGMPGPRWLTYFAVDDVDASLATITAAGGAVHMPAMTMPGVGRMALVADPQGATFYVMHGESEASAAFRQADQATPGHAVWNELASPDPAAALPFYAEQLGIREEGAMPMGDLGDYRFLHAGDAAIGAAMGMVPNGRPGWQPYFMVDDIDAGAARVTEGGGTLVQGPDQIPGGSFSLVCEDPAGARFGLVAERKGK